MHFRMSVKHAVQSKLKSEINKNNLIGTTKTEKKLKSYNRFLKKLSYIFSVFSIAYCLQLVLNYFYPKLFGR